MNKTELVAKMAEKAEVSKKDAEKMFNAFIDTVEETVKADDKVQLVGFGTFESRERTAREGKNPRTEKKLQFPLARFRHLKPEKHLRICSNNLIDLNAYVINKFA